MKLLFHFNARVRASEAVLASLRGLSAAEALGEAGSVEAIRTEQAVRYIQTMWRAKAARKAAAHRRAAEERKLDNAAAYIQQRYKEAKEAKGGGALARDAVGSRAREGAGAAAPAPAHPSGEALARAAETVRRRAAARIEGAGGARGGPTSEEKATLSAYLAARRREGEGARERAGGAWQLATRKVSTSLARDAGRPAWEAAAEDAKESARADAARMWAAFQEGRAEARGVAAQGEEALGAAAALHTSLRCGPSTLEELPLNAAPKSFTKGMSAARWKTALAGHKAAMAAATAGAWWTLLDTDHAFDRPVGWEEATARTEASKRVAEEAARRLMSLGGAGGREEDPRQGQTVV